jgi:hypothetical protein
VRRAIPILRGLPILIVMIAAAVAGMAWAISSPIGSSPDDDYHLASIWCPPPVETSGCQVQVNAQGTTTVTLHIRVFAAPACYDYHPDNSAACIWAIPADKTGNDGRFDRGEYPGGFYHVMHLFAGNDPYTSVYRMRAFNVALSIVLGALLVLAATRPARRILAYAVASTYVSMGMFIVPSVNPSSWALIGVTTAAFALHSYWIAESRSRVIVNATLTAVGVGLAASARGDAAMYAILAAVAVTCLHYRSVRRHLVRLVLPGAILVVGLIVFRMSSQATVALSEGALGSSNPRGGWSLLFSNIVNIPTLALGNQGLPGLGGLGWLDTPMPPIVYVSTVTVCAFLMMAGVGRLSWMKALVAGGGILAVVAIPLYILQVSNIVVGQDVQPRYILPLLPVVFLVLLTGYRPDQAVRLSRPAAWLAWALVSGANSVASWSTSAATPPAWTAPSGPVEQSSGGARGSLDRWRPGSSEHSASPWPPGWWYDSRRGPTRPSPSLLRATRRQSHRPRPLSHHSRRPSRSSMESPLLSRTARTTLLCVRPERRPRRRRSGPRPPAFRSSPAELRSPRPVGATCPRVERAPRRTAPRPRAGAARPRRT